VAITIGNILTFREILGKRLWIIAVYVMVKYCYGLNHLSIGFRLSENANSRKLGVDIKELRIREFAKMPILGQPGLV
jgi:hypothetical protein